MKLAVLTGVQRSGTTALQSALSRTGQVHNCGEIFHALVGHTPENYFAFLERDAVSRDLVPFPSPENRAVVLGRYLEFLEGASDRPWTLLDVKYNSFHAVDPIWQDPLAVPHLMSQLNERGAVFIHIRRGAFPVVLSQLWAAQTGVYHYGSGIEYDQAGLEKATGARERRGMASMSLDCGAVEASMAQIEATQDLFDNHLAGMSQVVSIQYESLYQSGQPVGEGASELCEALGITGALSTTLTPSPNKQFMVADPEHVIGYFDNTRFRDQVRLWFGIGDVAVAARSLPTIQNSNPWTEVSPTPFEKASRVHPNLEGDDLEVCWTDVPLFGAKAVQFEALAFDEDAQNMGAVITATLDLPGRASLSTGPIELDPREPTKFRIPLPAMPAKGALRLQVGRRPGTPGYAATVWLQPSKLI